MGIFPTGIAIFFLFRDLSMSILVLLYSELLLQEGSVLQGNVTLVFLKINSILKLLPSLLLETHMLMTFKFRAKVPICVISRDSSKALSIASWKSGVKTIAECLQTRFLSFTFAIAVVCILTLGHKRISVMDSVSSKWLSIANDVHSTCSAIEE